MKTLRGGMVEDGKGPPPGDYDDWQVPANRFAFRDSRFMVPVGGDLSLDIALPQSS